MFTVMTARRPVISLLSAVLAEAKAELGALAELKKKMEGGS